MRLFEAILDANHRAVAGDASAGLHPAEFADALPVVALTCIDPRLNAYFPNALALPNEDFIWLRNAGNIVTSTLSSTLRSLALACAVKGGREIAVIGHSDCQIGHTSTMALLDKLKALGVDRSCLPENLNEFFGAFSSERQNVIKACEFIRHSPLIGPRIPVHGLMLDLQTGNLDWVVNGYDSLSRALPAEADSKPALVPPSHLAELGSFKEFAMGEMKCPDLKIGEVTTRLESEFAPQVAGLEAKIEDKVVQAVPAVEQMASQMAQTAERKWPKLPPLRPKPPALLTPKKNPLPPPIRPRADLRRG
jgi:carbonic anhydrase